MNGRAEGRWEQMRMWNKEEGRIRKSSVVRNSATLCPREDNVECRMLAQTFKSKLNKSTTTRGGGSYLNVENGNSGLQLTGIIVALTTITFACNFFRNDESTVSATVEPFSVISGPLHLKFHGIDATFMPADSSFLTSRCALEDILFE